MLTDKDKEEIASLIRFKEMLKKVRLMKRKLRLENYE